MVYPTAAISSTRITSSSSGRTTIFGSSEELQQPQQLPLPLPPAVSFYTLSSPPHEKDPYYVAVATLIKGFSREPYFFAVEGLWVKYGGRPHWGKTHFLKNVGIQLYVCMNR